MTTPPPAPLSVAWQGGLAGPLRLIDQTRLPEALEFIDCRSPEQVWVAIERLKVRGAPAIGIAAAWGVLLEFAGEAPATGDELMERVVKSCEYLASSRPTAVNLAWALARMRRAALSARDATFFDGVAALQRLHDEARAIHDEDRAMCRAIGLHGSALLSDCRGVLTHCNTGGLATSEYGTALSAIFTAVDQGQALHVFVDETRPLLQGARLTAWELAQRGIPATLICDSMAAQVMREGKVQAVIVGADRIAANGDTANKIGTYTVAVLAHRHGVPFYVAAPLSTIDARTATGADIPIEERHADEVTRVLGAPIAPRGTEAVNFAFDVTPHELIAGIVTEAGILRPPYAESIARALAG